jgi:hypothetical protein
MLYYWLFRIKSYGKLLIFSTQLWFDVTVAEAGTDVCRFVLRWWIRQAWSSRCTVPRWQTISSCRRGCSGVGHAVGQTTPTGSKRGRCSSDMSCWRKRRSICQGPPIDVGHSNHFIWNKQDWRSTHRTPSILSLAVSTCSILSKKSLNMQEETSTSVGATEFVLKIQFKWSLDTLLSVLQPAQCFMTKHTTQSRLFSGRIRWDSAMGQQINLPLPFPLHTNTVTNSTRI